MGTTTTPAPADLVGTFAVPDPDDPDRMTFWTAGGGRLNPWPDGMRWAPLPPKFDRSDPDRKQQVDDFYAEVYHPWKRRVIDAINADREAATERFQEFHGNVELPPVPVRSPRAPRSGRRRSANDEVQRRRIEEQLLTAILRNAGQSYGQVADLLGIPKTTAYRREREAVAKVGADNVLVWSLLLVRATDIETTLRTALITQTGPVDADRVERWVADLNESCRLLRSSLVLGQG